MGLNFHGGMGQGNKFWSLFFFFFTENETESGGVYVHASGKMVLVFCFGVWELGESE